MALEHGVAQEVAEYSMKMAAKPDVDSFVMLTNHRANAQTHWFVMTQSEGLQWAESLATVCLDR